MPQKRPSPKALAATRLARERALTSAITIWLQRVAAREINQALQDGRRALAGKPPAIAKAKPRDEDDLASLLEILSRFGMVQAQDGIDAMGGQIDVTAATTDQLKMTMAPGLVADYIATKTVQLQRLPATIRQEVRESVRRIIDDALHESPQPSPGDLARRIKQQYYGESGKPISESIDTLPTGTSTRINVEGLSTKTGTAYAISSERAAAIARTELTQVENTAKYNGLVALGAERVKWIAVTSDRASGKREHWKMNGKEANVGDYFTLPSGEQLLYPGDTNAPIGETINCRCTLKVVKFKRPT